MRDNSDNVVPLKPRTNKRAERQEQEREQAERERAAHEREIERARIAIDRLKGSSRGKKLATLSAQDRASLASNLEKILDQVEAQGASRLQVVDKAGLGGPGTSTKALYRYTLPARLEGQARESRQSKLLGKLDNYLELAREAAKAVDKPDDDYVPQLLRGSSIIEADDPAVDGLPWPSDTRWRLHELGSGLVRTFDLDAYYRDLSSGHLGWQLVEGIGNYHNCFHAIRRSPVSLNFDDSVPHRFCGFVPSVRLYTAKLGQIFAGKAVFVRPDEKDDFHIYPQGIGQDERLQLFKRRCEAHSDWCRVFAEFELRLALAPMGNRGLWEPCFERRLLLRYSSLGSSRLNFSTYNLDVEYKILGRSSRFGIGESSLSFVSPGQEVDRDELTRVSVEWNWEAGTVRYCLDETMVDEVEKRLIGIFGTEFDEALENVYLARIDVANCQRYLGNLEWLVEDPDDVQLGPWWQGWRDVAGIGGGDWSDSWHYNLSDSTKPYLGEVPEGTVAAALVHNLLFEEGEQRLDHLLAAEVRRLTTQAREGVQQAEDDFRARDAALRQRWRDGTFVDESGG